jgi:glycosyltransferase involved in cell wall biosynthesis
VLWVQDLWPESLSATGYVRNRFIIAAVRKVVCFIYHHTDLILVQSKAFEEPIRALEPVTPIIYYPNSVDKSFAAPTALEIPTVNGLGEGFSVMFAGNVGVAQAVEVIVEAASILKKYTDIHFVVLGEGSRWGWMCQEKQRLDLGNLHLPGRFPVETMPGLMQKASALLVTLADQVIFNATIPSKVQAYLAAGRPILACLNGEGASLVTSAGAGLAVPAENGGALAEAILHLYRMSPKNLDAMGALGRLYYNEHFEHDLLIDQLICHLQSVCNHKENVE